MEDSPASLREQRLVQHPPLWLQSGARPKYLLQGVLAFWLSVSLFMVFTSIVYSIFPDASCIETDVEIFKRGPEQYLKSSARKMASNDSSSTTMAMDEVRSRQYWREILVFQWSSSFCTVLCEHNPRGCQRAIWGPINATTWLSMTTPAVTIFLVIDSPAQMGRANCFSHRTASCWIQYVDSACPLSLNKLI